MNDGTFGTTAEAASLDPEMVARIENHEFEAIRQVFWRNPALHFGSVADLQQSLAVRSDTPGLVRAREADDEVVLNHLSRDPEIANLAIGADAVEMLWEVCQIPDFRKVMSDAHARLLGIIYGHLMGPARRLPTDWLAAQVSRLDRVDGDIDTLMQRISGVRIWTYVSFRSQWIEDAIHWQERTRDIEDRLSDALHERLTQRFVDKRTALLVSRLKEREKLLAAVNADGDVLVEGHYAGRLEGFRFIPETDVHALSGTAATKSVATATGKALRGEISDRVKRLTADADSAFSLSEGDNGGFSHDMLWRGDIVARLGAGHSLLKPSVTANTFELVEPARREAIERRLRAWLQALLDAAFAPLIAAEAAVPAGAARGIVFRLSESLGSIGRRRVVDGIDALSKGHRQALRKSGVRIGRETIYLPELLRPAVIRLRGLLWELYHDMPPSPSLPPPGRVSVVMTDDVPAAYYEAVGFHPMGRLAVRMDMVERLAGQAWSLNRSGAFSIGPELLTLAGCDEGDMAIILGRLGYQVKTVNGETRYRYRPASSSKGADVKRQKQAAAQSNSPFAKLKGMAARR
jgi:ATP-dependent RNA helicase SUPV3L1/SUV3